MNETILIRTGDEILTIVCPALQSSSWESLLWLLVITGILIVLLVWGAVR